VLSYLRAIHTVWSGKGRWFYVELIILIVNFDVVC